ncbi:MFS transporter [Tenacibaculum xiamenense]|uniref:MFS transporter n=1 Tax=Tenacibaculum xiamenense TaxID=1261553 RepID=UPI003895F522
MREKTVVLGLKENWKQFLLLLIVNAFVGGMVGLERTILPELAEKHFLITATSVVLSFIIVFGIVKAITNYFTGVLANRIGRKKLLVIGWLVAVPIPFILMYAENWNWIIFANVLLGINQGLAWSSTVVMKIDLVGEKNRGLAMGLNESFGYLSIAIVAYTTGWIAANYGLRPYPFYQGVGFVVLGILISVFFIKDTAKYVAVETKTTKVKEHQNVFWNATWKDRNLGSISQAGFVNNLNDGMIWGILPVILSNRGFNLKDIALIVAIYPAIWGVGQLITGKLSDHYNKKNMLFVGMALQGISLIAMFWAVHKLSFIVLSSILGGGTAIVYPTFLSAIADHTNPNQRAESIGVFRLWRDLGYSFGAIITIAIAQFLEVDFTILCIGALTMFSALIIKLRMT